jgi:hypothetical protein
VLQEAEKKLQAYAPAAPTDVTPTTEPESVGSRASSTATHLPNRSSSHQHGHRYNRHYQEQPTKASQPEQPWLDPAAFMQLTPEQQQQWMAKMMQYADEQDALINAAQQEHGADESEFEQHKRFIDQIRQQYQIPSTATDEQQHHYQASHDLEATTYTALQSTSFKPEVASEDSDRLALQQPGGEKPSSDSSDDEHAKDDGGPYGAWTTVTKKSKPVFTSIFGAAATTKGLVGGGGDDDDDGTSALSSRSHYAHGRGGLDDHDPDEDMDSEDEMLERLEHRKRPTTTTTMATSSTLPSSTTSTTTDQPNSSSVSTYRHTNPKSRGTKRQQLIALPTAIIGKGISSTAPSSSAGTSANAPSVSSKLADIRFKSEEVKTEAADEEDPFAMIQLRSRKRPATSQRGQIRKRQTVSAYGNEDSDSDS